jgi:hypothetical protein
VVQLYTIRFDSPSKSNLGFPTNTRAIAILVGVNDIKVFELNEKLTIEYTIYLRDYMRWLLIAFVLPLLLPTTQLMIIGLKKNE